MPLAASITMKASSMSARSAKSRRSLTHGFFAICLMSLLSSQSTSVAAQAQHPVKTAGWGADPTAHSGIPTVSAPTEGAALEQSPSPLVGSLRVESSEPGTLLINDAEYGTLPLIVENLPASAQRLVVKFFAGDSETRIVGVESGKETLVKFDATPSLLAFRLHAGTHFGFGGEPSVSVILDRDQLGYGMRIFGRVNYAFSRVVEVRGDLVVGSTLRPNRPQQFAVLLRGDVQLNWGSIYTMGAGVDVGMCTFKGPFIVGVHASLLGVRFGSNREFLLHLQQGLMHNNGFDAFEQTLSLAYTLL